MSTLLDRLLEVAKDFEAERLQDQLGSQRRERQLEQDLKALKRTAMYRADEITFLENQLQDVRTEVEASNEALRDAQEHNAKEASTVEVDMRRELVCLRLEIGRLKKINKTLVARADQVAQGNEKENSSITNGSGLASTTAAAAAAAAVHLTAVELEAQEAPVLLSREGIDIQETASSFYLAAENGDLTTLEELLTPSCVCIDSYEHLLTRALSSVCAASATSAVLATSALDGEGGEGGDNAENDNDNDADNGPKVAAARRLSVAKLLIAEGAITTTHVEHVESASGSGTNAVKSNQTVSPAPLHVAAWSGDAGLVELLLSQPNPPLNVPCESTGNSSTGSALLKGTPLQLAVGTTRGEASVVVKALLMAGANPEKVLAANMDQNGDSLSREMKRVFDDCTVMFWNSSVRAFEAYSSNNYDQALEIWGGALMYIKKGKLPISGADKARLYYNRARAMCHLRRRVDALEELDLALELSPSYSNARVLQAESYFELYSFDKCLNSIQSIPTEMCATNEKIINMKTKAMQQKQMTHYQVLGLHGPPSSESEIKKAYRKQSMKWHPDKHQQNKDSTQRATTTFKRLNEANQVLGDTYAKMMYDSEIEINVARQQYGHGDSSSSSSSSSSNSNSAYSGGYNSGSSRRSSTTAEGGGGSSGSSGSGVHRTTFDSSSRSRRASAPVSSHEKNASGSDARYDYGNYADRQQHRRREEEHLREEDVLSETDEEDLEEDLDDDFLASNMDAWRKADVLNSMEYDQDDLGGEYSYGYDESI